MRPNQPLQNDNSKKGEWGITMRSALAAIAAALAVVAATPTGQESERNAKAGKLLYVKSPSVQILYRWLHTPKEHPQANELNRVALIRYADRLAGRDGGPLKRF
jgi:hypothetical protein